jgi:lipoprotein-releasing system permease protein
LGFILLIASFNVIGTLSMLVIEKKKDIFVMQSLGASLKDIRRIFLIQGSLMIFLGGLIGVFVGGIVCWLQQEFELIGFATSGNFVVSSYPVKMIWTDFVVVTLLILLIGVLSSLYPVMKINRKFFTNNEALKSY